MFYWDIPLLRNKIANFIFEGNFGHNRLLFKEKATADKLRAH